MKLKVLALGLIGSFLLLNANDKIEVGVRPFYLIDKLENKALQNKLQKCENMELKKTDFSIGHRGACMQFPEHSKESYIAAAKMGAGILECDVTFTKDKELVCRHSQCDLHTTTNIVDSPLANKCSVPPKVVDGKLTNAKEIKCCTSDITLAEFKTLDAKMDAANKNASTIKEYINATASHRTDRYSDRATLMTHKESIELFKALGVKMTPELKSPSVKMPYLGMTQEDYATKMIEEYQAAKVDPSDVYAQSFNYTDVLYWIKQHPKFGKQAVYLDGRYGETEDDKKNFANFNPTDATTWDSRDMESIKKDGINIIAPPLWFLATLDKDNKIVPTPYAKEAKKAGLDIITWTLERSGLLKDGGGWYYQNIKDATTNEGVTYELLDVLAKDVGVIGVFSDWPATTTFYGNCMNLQ